MRCAHVCWALAALAAARLLAAFLWPGPLLTPAERVLLREAFDETYTGSHGSGAAAATPPSLAELAGKAADAAGGARRAMLRYFADQAYPDEGGSVCNDLNTVMFALKASFERDARAGLLVDVGANTGQTTLEMVRFFEQRMLSVAPRKSQAILKEKFNKAVRRNRGDICLDANGPLRVHSFEANPLSHKLLRKVVRWELGSAEHNVSLHCALVSDAEGSARVYHRGAGDQEASASRATVRDVGEDLDRSSEVEAVTLDGFFAAERRAIHLLKVDTEGFDPVVLRGARTLLSSAFVKFLVFEYSSKWRSAGHGITLKNTVDELEGHGYTCFLIKPNVLVPLTGPWWQRVYEPQLQIFVANVFCGRTADHDLFDAYVAFGTSSYALLYALASLQLDGAPDRP